MDCPAAKKLFLFGCPRLLVSASGQQQVNTNWPGAAYRAKRGEEEQRLFSPTAPMWSRPTSFFAPTPNLPLNLAHPLAAAAGAGVYRNFAAIVGKGGWLGVLKVLAVTPRAGFRDPLGGGGRGECSYRRLPDGTFVSVQEARPLLSIKLISVSILLRGENKKKSFLGFLSPLSFCCSRLTSAFLIGMKSPFPPSFLPVRKWKRKKGGKTLQKKQFPSNFLSSSFLPLTDFLLLLLFPSASPSPPSPTISFHPLKTASVGEREGEKGSEKKKNSLTIAAPWKLWMEEVKGRKLPRGRLSIPFLAHIYNRTSPQKKKKKKKKTLFVPE